MREAAAMALAPDAKTISGPHCSGCRFKATCSSCIDSGAALFEISNEPFPVNMSAESIALLYRIVKNGCDRMKDLQTGLVEEVKARIRSGESLPGLSVDETAGRLAWNRPVSEVCSLGDLMGVELRKDGAITPTQAIAAGMDAELINGYADRPKTGFKLNDAPDEKARKIFS